MGAPFSSSRSSTTLTPLFSILLKHLKRIVVSIEGGFQLIADLNAYHSFIVSLRQPAITAYFTSLKMVGEIFIVDSPKDLSHLVRDVSRYEGTLSTEDLYEIGQFATPPSLDSRTDSGTRLRAVQRRADWRKIEKEVERGLFGFKKEDCIVRFIFYPPARAHVFTPKYLLQIV